MRNVKIPPVTGKKTEAIIFDLGGVLLNLDFESSIKEFIRLGFKDVRHELSVLLSAQPTPGNESLFHLYEKGLIGSDRFRDGLRELAGRHIGDQDIDRAWTSMLLDIHSENVQVLESLKGSYRLFLLSNTNAIHIETLHGREDNGSHYSRLVKVFEKVYYSHEVNMRKPDAEIFEHVIRDAGLTPEETLFIDDAETNVKAARGCGLMAYHHKAGAGFDGIFTASRRSP